MSFSANDFHLEEYDLTLNERNLCFAFVVVAVADE